MDLLLKEMMVENCDVLYFILGEEQVGGGGGVVGIGCVWYV